MGAFADDAGMSNPLQVWAAVAVVWPHGAQRGGGGSVDSIVSVEVILVAAITVVIIISLDVAAEDGVSGVVDEGAV